MSDDLLERVHRVESFSPLDLRLAQLLRRLSRQDTAADLLATSAALVSRQRGQGHSCLHLDRWGGRVLGAKGTAAESWVRLPSRDAWRTVLEQSSLVAVTPRLGDEPRPLVLDGGDRLYLWRYWQAEQSLARQLLQRSAEGWVEPTPLTVELFQRLFPRVTESTAAESTAAESTAAESTAAESTAAESTAAEPHGDRQALAAAVALNGTFTVISGGPGTGKTTTVTRILALLAAQDRETRFALAAPTGKAAARLEESIAEQLTKLSVAPEIRGRIPRSASTLHRLLGYSPRRDTFRHGEGSPLPADVLVVDEASMVDLLMMQNVVEALPPTARLILLGDRDQLASVDTGFVFGDLTTAVGLGRAGAVDPAAAASYEPLAGRPWPGPVMDGAVDPAEQREMQGEIQGEVQAESTIAVPLRGRGVELDISYRFRLRQGIGTVAGAIRRGDAPTVRRALDDPALDDVAWQPLPDLPDRSLLATLEDKILACRRAPDPAVALARLAEFRILAATRIGSWGTERLNVLVETLLDFHGFPSLERFYPGRPVLVESNDYQSRLFNGDLGMIWPEQGSLWAFFPDEAAASSSGALPEIPSRLSPGAGLRRLPLAKLPRHSTAWAMTVHKSQGSEFDHVLLVLPEHDLGDLLSRELLYTAVTRAKQRVDVRAPGLVLEQAVGRSSRRRSGLVEALAAASSTV